MDWRYQSFIRLIKSRNDEGLCMREGCFGHPSVTMDITIYIDIGGELTFKAGACSAHAQQYAVKSEKAAELERKLRR